MIRLIALLIAIFFLPSTAAAASSGWQPELRIGLFTTSTPITLKFSLPTNFGTQARVSLDNGKLKVDDRLIDGDSIDFRPKLDAQLREMISSIDGKNYFGGVRLILRDKNLIVINLVPIEQYLRGVIPVEMPSGWHVEALKAQTIAARTFALNNRKRHDADGYDLCATTHCQTYGGVEVSARSTDEAIASTFGEVLTFNGKLINAPFHTDSGGRTASAAEVWSTAVAYLQSVKDVASMPWTIKIPLEKFDVGTFKSIGIESRTESGRVARVKVVGSKRTLELSGAEMRQRFELKSTLFEVDRDGDSIVVNGYGWGHGVGLSQYGAKGYAERGSKSDAILKHYYRGVALKKLY